MIRTTQPQFAEMRASLQKSNMYRNEKVWTFLVASLFDRAADQSKIIKMLCGEPLHVDHHVDIWFEGEPIPPRKCAKGNSEGNTMLDLAFGHILPRGTTASGITYGPPQESSWVCFVEAKCLSDCSTTVAYDPLRNQLSRIIENLLCFQREGQFPERLFFTLLTPRLFQQNPYARLYGYKMREYKEDPEKILADIERCRFERRKDLGFIYPDLRSRLAAFHLNWVSYEDLLEPEMGTNLDIVGAPGLVHGLQDMIVGTITKLASIPANC